MTATFAPPEAWRQPDPRQNLRQPDPPQPGPRESGQSQDPLRLLAIAANLLPTEITDARRTKKLQHAVSVLLVFLVVVLAGWDIEARLQTSSAQSALNKAEIQSQVLQHQQGSYASFTATKTTAKAITTELQTLMAQDLQWWKLLPALRAVAPPGVALTAVSGSVVTAVGGTTGQLPPAQPGLTSTTAVGSISISGNAPDKVQIAVFVQALNSVAGLADCYLESATSQNAGPYVFSVDVEITAAALGGRYSAAGGH